VCVYVICVHTCATRQNRYCGVFSGLRFNKLVTWNWKLILASSDHRTQVHTIYVSVNLSWFPLQQNQTRLLYTHSLQLAQTGRKSSVVLHFYIYIIIHVFNSVYSYQYISLIKCKLQIGMNIIHHSVTNRTFFWLVPVVSIEPPLPYTNTRWQRVFHSEIYITDNFLNVLQKHLWLITATNRARNKISVLRNILLSFSMQWSLLACNILPF